MMDKNVMHLYLEERGFQQRYNQFPDIIMRSGN